MGDCSFCIRLNDSDEKIAEDFEKFLEKRRLVPKELHEIAFEFETCLVPKLDDFRKLAANGSNLEFSQSFETTRGKIVAQLDTTPKSLLRQLRGLIGL